MDNIKLVIAYDGTHYFGWQKTKMGPSIEGVLQKTLEQILQHPVQLQAVSRTDAGVHAKGQVVNLFTSGKIDLSRLQLSLNQLLPSDISVIEIEKMPPSFHPTLDAKWKEYHYHITNSPFQWPHLRLYAWHFPCELNIALMDEAARLFVGEHDFTAFTNFRKGKLPDDYIRCLREVKIISLPDSKILVKMVGNRFLYRMARNLAGTLAYIGSGKMEASAIPQLLKSGSRPDAGITAPAHGLFLNSVAF